ncbi:MAG: hypothetical protein QW808_02945 [Desulfurococcaceae archaeon]
MTRRSERKVRKVKASIEREFVYPLLRGRDVERWKATREIYMVLPG